MKKLTALLLSIFMSDANAEDRWVAQVTEAHNFLSERQNALMEDYKLGEHERFDWDQETSSLVFSNEGVPAVVAQVQFVGSISTISNTWLWSWANPSIVDEARDQIHRVKSFGEKHGYDALTIDKWEGDEVDGWEMTSIAAFVLNAKGAYRTGSDNGFTYMVITDIEWVQN
ncbi:DUF6882 domain-containing protein [Marinobacter salarius]|jgi:hypothetical protein|uniref:DUF6882 domain-containing protein n=1 Tax=Marinobacter salarius TaxID=1420917 RepID=UPI000F85325A|nr:DUF6882 domain-containing protein [Marinobacter salarius]AZR39519.1 hypothetical protein MTMN5_00036 [Marinobacter salarius]